MSVSTTLIAVSCVKAAVGVTSGRKQGRPKVSTTIDNGTAKSYGM
jgi:hypothetical protein